MKGKKLFISIIVVCLVFIMGTIVYFIGFKQDKNTTLTLIERQWIESNKSKLIDVSIISNVPIVTYNGEGIFFDFLADLEDDTKLEFNRVAYNKTSDIKTEYALKVVDAIEDNQVLIYEDDYVLVTNDNKKINSINSIKDMKIGVLSGDLDRVNTYVNMDSTNVLKSFQNYSSMIAELTGDNENKVDAIVLPKLECFNEIVSNSKLNIAYHISEMKRYYVLQLGNIDRLNNILMKYFDKWKTESYKESYQKQFLDSYLSFSNVDDKKNVEFKSKRYVYGFIENNPYDYIIDGKYVGINHAILTNFSDIAGVDISYKKYNDIDSLINDFNANKIDIIFNNTTYLDFNMDVINTVSPVDEKIVVLAKPNDELVVNSINSLIGSDVMAVKSTRLADYLVKNGINTKVYNNVDDLLNHVNKNSVIVLDYDTYNYYAAKDFKDFRVLNISDFDYDYVYTIRNISDNELFAQIFNFYLSFNNERTMSNEGYNEVLSMASRPFSLRKLLLTLVGMVSSIILIIIGIKIFKPKNKKIKKVNLSKEDKLKYIDMLTSLKNRNYLNDNIERWDSSEVYPQTIIIIDLNNVAYINDNYGHAEGDKVIGEAANILINTQMPNSEVIRTNGNEFLVYMVGYGEKQAISYIRKLNKELKSLSHGFGAAIGYSMINDAIKTVDDAINEATAVMKEIKEEIDY